MEYSLPDTVVDIEDLDENKTIFLLSKKTQYSSVQFHEPDFDENRTKDATSETPFADDSCSEQESSSESGSEPMSFMGSLSEEELVLLHEECLRMFGEYFDDVTNMAKMSSPLIEQLVTTDIAYSMFELLEENDEDMDDDDYEDLYTFVLTQVVEYAFENELGVVPRQTKEESALNREALGKSPAFGKGPAFSKSQEAFGRSLNRALIEKKLHLVASCPIQEQRTQAWYDIRHNALTASNIWKALGSEAQRNSLIFEKCKPYDQFVTECNKHANLCTDNSMHWGIKYEPVTVQIYEHYHQTKVNTAYGCILHPDYPFIGASPDAIVTDPESPKYGRMVEIKNIVNREITGVPLEHYWIQMQIQMEVCDLDECDFVETQVREYETADAFYNHPNEHSIRGIAIRFTKRLYMDDFIEQQRGTHPQMDIDTEYSPFYEYSPLYESTHQEAKQWVQETKQRHAKNYVAFSISYWYLDKYSCVVVKRNRDWFDAVLPKLEDCWTTIQKEKTEGYDHRAPRTSRKSGPLIQVCKLD
jgi:putative phage-type endonuclease